MSLEYKSVLWNPQKKRYDSWIALGIIIYILSFAGFTAITQKDCTIETLIIRSFGSLSITMLQLILCIGPLCRLSHYFLPLLYNRRHLGVAMFFMALTHGIFSLIQFHALGNEGIINSLFTSNLDYDHSSDFPFQTLGFFALVILFLMASTSHDFWNKHLGAILWKRLHMFVYIAYTLVAFHVLLGAYQQDHQLYLILQVGIGSGILITLHLITGIAEWTSDREFLRSHNRVDKNGYIYICLIDDIDENCAKVVQLGNERIAIFKYDNKVSAVSNVCKHQNGPLGEGKIIDGCITCPWHGYQYNPENGQSPPPFTETINTYDVKLKGKEVFVHPVPLGEGVPSNPKTIR
ncbi:Rieske 2Fe-2S domain-containing protein [Flammeovirga agarivorans]|uniref:Rieske 2Fe-2S domain-containing protein n=1 Tax=Flammeovirga agarivorans TaxID=2726742 RepID=A0A7X8SJ03_9BACT|nr:Rieske 2Fe-2S domain-containing protein [Flammeovirga agarivorans]NLR91012.1 Rieske 2Fe-2S domain-containing protein [Flammeovirga agarivorans]